MDYKPLIWEKTLSRMKHEDGIIVFILGVKIKEYGSHKNIWSNN